MMRGAREHYGAAIDVLERAHGRDHPDVAVTLGNLGVFLQTNGEWNGAREAYDRALAIQIRALGGGTPPRGGMPGESRMVGR